MHLADNLVADDGVLAHGERFVGIEGRGLGEQSLIDRDHADIVEIAGRAQRRDLARLHLESLANGLGVAADAQGMSVDVHVFDVDGGGEGLKRVVVKAVQRGEQAHIFGDSLLDRLTE